MQITVDIPGEFAAELAQVPPSELRSILSLGISEWRSRGTTQFAGLQGLLERLAALPEPSEILKLRPAAELQARANELLEKSRTNALSEAEEAEWQRIEFAEHLVRIAKAQAALKLQRSTLC